MIRRLTLVLAAALCFAAVPTLSPATAAGGEGPSATKAGVLVNYLPTGRIRVQRNIGYQFVCSANCTVTATATFVVPGRDVVVTSSGTFPAGQVGIHRLTLSRGLRKTIKDSRKAKLNSAITAVNVDTGASETETHTFKFKR